MSQIELDAADKAKVLDLVDRQQIEELMSRYAHGVDRHDEELIGAVYHPDATDWHGPFRGGVAAFIGWVNPLHEGKTRAHTHNITTHWSEVDGCSAWAETYVLFALFLRDRDVVMLGSGRYIDRLERREGRWKLAERSTVTDARIEADGTCFRGAPGGYAAGTWDRRDLSYDRPLTIASAPFTEPTALPVAHGSGGESLDDLWNRRAIRDCIVQALRGLDRDYRNLLLASFHDDATVEDGAPAVNAAAWIEAKLNDFLANDAATSHNLTTQSLKLEGDRAKVESYVIVMRRRLNDTSAWVGSIRLLDELERRDGRWGITSRRVIGDWEFEADGSLFATDDLYLHGSRDDQDPWHRRAELGGLA